MKKLFLVPFIAACFVSCAAIDKFTSYSEGTEITEQQLESVVVGKTTKDYLEQNFGAPSRISNSSECEMWHYDYNKIKSFGANVNVSNVFCINKKGVVIKKLKGKAGGSSNPLLRAAGH